MGVVLLVCGVAALVAALFAGAFLPDTRSAPGGASGTPAMAEPEADARQ
jgi:hypothetical protein